MLLLMLAGFGAPAKDALIIQNENLTAKWDLKSSRLTVTRKSSDQMFLSNADFSERIVVAEKKSVTDRTFGSGQALTLSDIKGNRSEVMLFPKLPFVLIRSMLVNQGPDLMVVKRARTFTVDVEVGKPVSQLTTLGTGGLLPVGKNPGSYVWLAVADPQSRKGVVFGWLTENRGSGVLFSEVTNSKARVAAQIDYGKLRLAPGSSEKLETLAIGCFDDARLGLEQWADAVAKVYDIHLPLQPAGYCTWYSKPYGGAADEKHLAELAAFSATNLAPFGFSVVQIDDKWQAGWKRSSPSSPKKNFTTHDPNGPYPSGMKAAADQIKSLGLTPGIWFMPFAGTVGDPYFDQHLDWFAKTADGNPYDTPWGGTCFDLTQPGAREHVRDIVSRICREWGFQYIKIDGLWTGTATKQLYVNSGYKEDDIGEAVFHDPKKTNIEVYRDGLKLVREAAGKNVFILGCNAPQNMRSYGGSFGLVDAMRIGPDNKADWKSLLRGPTFGSRHYFLNRRIWHNDPDPVYVRTNVPLNHARLICTWVALSGQLNLSSEWLPGLPPDRLEILKRTMPGHDAIARPVDLFENDLPQIWTVTERGIQSASLTNHSTQNQSDTSREVIGLFNWDSSEKNFDIPLKRLGLDSRIEYTAFDFWGNRLIPSVQGRLQIAVPGESCVALAIRPLLNHPQVISTSRHVTQGMVALPEEQWDSAGKVLSGRAKVVGGDPFELRIVPGSSSLNPVVQVSLADVTAGVMTSLATENSLIRVRLNSAQSREIKWSVHFD